MHCNCDCHCLCYRFCIIQSNLKGLNTRQPSLSMAWYACLASFGSLSMNLDKLTQIEKSYLAIRSSLFAILNYNPQGQTNFSTKQITFLWSSSSLGVHLECPCLDFLLTVATTKDPEVACEVVSPPCSLSHEWNIWRCLPEYFCGLLMDSLIGRASLPGSEMCMVSANLCGFSCTVFTWIPRKLSTLFNSSW